MMIFSPLASTEGRWAADTVEKCLEKRKNYLQLTVCLDTSLRNCPPPLSRYSDCHWLARKTPSHDDKMCTAKRNGEKANQPLRCKRMRICPLLNSWKWKCFLVFHQYREYQTLGCATKPNRNPSPLPKLLEKQTWL